MGLSKPDTHLTISKVDVPDIPPEQTRAVGVRATRRALAEDWPREQLVEVLQMLDVIKTVPGGRTDHLGRRKT